MHLNNITANLRKAFIDYITELEQSEINTDNSNSDNNSDYPSSVVDNSASIFFKHATDFKQFAESSLKSMGLSVDEIRIAIDAAIRNSFKGDEAQIDEADEKTDEELNKKLEAKSDNNINNEAIKQQAEALGITPEELVEIANQAGVNPSEITPELIKQYPTSTSQNENNSDNTSNDDVNTASADTEAKEPTEAENSSKDEVSISNKSKEPTETENSSKDEPNNKKENKSEEEAPTNKSDSTSNSKSTDSTKENKETTDASNNTTNTNNANTTNSSSTTDTPTDTNNSNTTKDSTTTNATNVTNAADTSTATTTINKEVENLLTDIFNDAKSLNALDSDVDGKLSEEEKNKFKEYVKGKNNEITLENLNKAYDLIKNGKFDYNTPLDEITDTTNTATDATNATDKADTTNATDKADTANATDKADTANDSSADSPDSADSADKPSSSGRTHSPSSSSGGADSPSPSSDGADSPSPSSDGADSSADTQNSEDLTNMSVDELKSKRDTEIAPSVETAKSDLEKAKTDGDNLIKEKQEAYDKEKEQHDEAKKKYEDALGEDKFLTSPEGKELKEKLEENLKAITEAEEAKDKATQDISEKENLLSEAKTNTIEKQSEYVQAQANTKAAQSKVDTLTESVASLKSKESELLSQLNGADAFDQELSDRYKEIVSKRKAAEADLKIAEQELKDATKAEEEAKEASEDAQKAEDEAQEALNIAIDALTEASKAFDDTKDQREEIEKQIQENCDATTLQAYQDYIAQVDNLDTKQTEVQEATSSKLEAMTSAEEALKTNQEKLDEINTLITQKEGEEEASKLKSEHSATPDYQAAIDLAKQFLGKGMSAVQSSLEGVFHNGVWCADFVRSIVETAMGKDNLPDWYNKCGNKSSCSSIRDAAKRVNAMINLKDAKPGDLILFDWNHRGQGDDHVGIVTKVENGKVYTIEGNTNNSVVAEHEYDINSSSISYCCDMSNYTKVS